MASRKVFTPSMTMGRSGLVSSAPDVSKPGDGSGQILRDVEAAHALSQLYLALSAAPEETVATIGTLVCFGGYKIA